MATDKQSTILVAGGAGFIGSHLCQRLLNSGHSVICLDDFSTGRKSNIKNLKDNKNFKIIEADVRELPAINNIDEIYNLASPASPPAYQKDPIKTLMTGVLGTYNILQLAEKNKARVVHASTSEIYGSPKEHPQKETYWGNVNPIGIRSCYDEGKRAAETLCTDFKNSRGMDVRIARIFNTYGPNMDPEDGRVVSNFIVQAIKNRPLTIYGDGSQTRSFQYADDLVDGLVSLMENEIAAGPVNLGNPDEFTINQLADVVLKLIPESQSQKKFLPLPADDPPQRQPDISLAKQLLHWEPKIHLEEGLVKTINYFKSIV